MPVQGAVVVGLGRGERRQHRALVVGGGARGRGGQADPPPAHGAKLLHERRQGAIGLFARAAAGQFEVRLQPVAGGPRGQQPEGAQQQPLAVAECAVRRIEVVHDPLHRRTRTLLQLRVVRN
jgi:hypothetical protein